MNNRKNWPTIIREGKATMVFNAGHDLLHYLDGTFPPNYPMPATDANAEVALIWMEWDEAFKHNCPLCVGNLLDYLEGAILEVNYDQARR